MTVVFLLAVNFRINNVANLWKCNIRGKAQPGENTAVTKLASGKGCSASHREMQMRKLHDCVC